MIAQRIAKFGLRLQAERDYDLVNTENDHRYRDYWQTLPPDDGAQGRDRAARQDRDAPAPDADRLDAAAQTGEVDGMLCGTWGTHRRCTCTTSTR